MLGAPWQTFTVLILRYGHWVQIGMGYQISDIGISRNKSHGQFEICTSTSRDLEPAFGSGIMAVIASLLGRLYGLSSGLGVCGCDH